MAFRPPTFNLTCNIWRGGNSVFNPPDLSQICNLAFGRRSDLVMYMPTTSTIPAGTYEASSAVMQLLLPALTDVRPYWHTGVIPVDPDVVECPGGSGRFYLALAVDDVGKGFSNEHRCAHVVLMTPLWRALNGNPNSVPVVPYPLP
jgi:hypothetical protein